MSDNDATLTALREAYREYANSADGAGSVQTRVVQRLVEAVFDVLADTAPAAAQEVERIVAPWRRVVYFLVNKPVWRNWGEGADRDLDAARALLSKPDEAVASADATASEDVTP